MCAPNATRPCKLLKVLVVPLLGEQSLFLGGKFYLHILSPMHPLAAVSTTTPQIGMPHFFPGQFLESSKLVFQASPSQGASDLVTVLFAKTTPWVVSAEKRAVLQISVPPKLWLLPFKRLSPDSEAIWGRSKGRSEAQRLLEVLLWPSDDI